jgi:Tfp pilus assembly protein PilF
MFVKASKVALAAVAVLLWSGVSFAQVGAIAGKVTDENGQGVKDVLVKIERLDVRGNYKVKTGKKGDYFHAGLPLGTYQVSVEENGNIVDRASGVRVGLGDPTIVNFDLGEVRRRAQQQQQGGGLPTKEEISAMSPEERQRYEEALKKRQQQISKNKELNESFNAGMEAKRLQDWPTAVTQLMKAAELDPEQHVVWANLAEAQSGLAQSKVGPERQKANDEAIVSYNKAITLQPENAAYHNNLGLALVKAGKADEGKQELAKAAELDPAKGGTYYFNLGAVMINTGNTEGAIDAFKKATEVDPNYADAYYQLGTAMVGAAKVKEDGSVEPVPGTVEAFQKYVDLKPTGPFAESSRQMIQSLTQGVETSYESEEKKKKKDKS